jgi:hypothetical protein
MKNTGSELRYRPYGYQPALDISFKSFIRSSNSGNAPIDSVLVTKRKIREKYLLLRVLDFQASRLRYR